MDEKQIKWELKSFEELDAMTMYQILDIRNRVFVEEQNIVYLDTDFKDMKAKHLMAFNADLRLIAYSRLFATDVYYEGYSAIGRVVVDKDCRSIGLGKTLLTKSIEVLKATEQKKIKIAAQAYLEKFYSSFGFVKVSEPYMLEDIFHIDMILEL